MAIDADKESSVVVSWCYEVRAQGTNYSLVLVYVVHVSPLKKGYCMVMSNVAVGVCLEALFFLSRLTVFLLGVASRCLGLVQISRHGIVASQGLS